MALALGIEDLVRLETVSRTLLSPLSAPNLEVWRQEAMQAVRALFGADSSMFSLPHQNLPFYASSHVDPAAIREMAAYIAHTATRTGTSREPLIDTFYRRRAALGLEVFNLDLMTELIDHQHVRSEFFNDVWARHGLHNVHVLYVDTPQGVSSLHVHHRGGASPFGEDGLTLLRTILPSFKAGLDAVARLVGHQATLDALEHPAVVLDLSGHERFRSAALQAMLQADPEHTRIEIELRRLLPVLTALGFPLRGQQGQTALAPPVREVQTARARYTLRGALLPPDAFGPGESVMVTVTSDAAPTLPPPDEIRLRLGLTRREAEVALLLAEGLSNKAIGERLFVSPHTARHHTENVLAKLGVNNRSEVALRLLAVA